MSLGVGEERSLIKRLKYLDGERVCSFNRTLRICLSVDNAKDCC